ncbi:hypothetical protein [Mycolicibacterium brumae]|nr:hypothetical protein [Mycolicibacterium brumae]MCV7194133.1 hypothetical protein [Mycolicibacterium brumae]UWW07500.1 hypothetical protein L2Z93_000515 [Mycolicibacterium brumae]
MILHDAEYLLDNFHETYDPDVLAARDAILAEHHLSNLADDEQPDTAVCRAEADDTAWTNLLLLLVEVREARATIHSRLAHDSALPTILGRLAHLHQDALHEVQEHWDQGVRAYLKAVGLRCDQSRCCFCGELVDRATWEFEGRCAKCMCVVCLDDDGEGWS